MQQSRLSFDFMSRLSLACSLIKRVEYLSPKGKSSFLHQHKLYARVPRGFHQKNEPTNHPRTRGRSIFWWWSNRTLRPTGTVLRRVHKALVPNPFLSVRTRRSYQLDVKLIELCWTRVRGD